MERVHFSNPARHLACMPPGRSASPYVLRGDPPSGDRNVRPHPRRGAHKSHLLRPERHGKPRRTIWAWGPGSCFIEPVFICSPTLWRVYVYFFLRRGGGTRALCLSAKDVELVAQALGPKLSTLTQSLSTAIRVVHPMILCAIFSGWLFCLTLIVQAISGPSGCLNPKYFCYPVLPSLSIYRPWA